MTFLFQLNTQHTPGTRLGDLKENSSWFKDGFPGLFSVFQLLVLTLNTHTPGPSKFNHASHRGTVTVIGSVTEGPETFCESLIKTTVTFIHQFSVTVTYGWVVRVRRHFGARGRSSDLAALLRQIPPRAPRAQLLRSSAQFRFDRTDQTRISPCPGLKGCNKKLLLTAQPTVHWQTTITSTPPTRTHP